MNQPMNFITVLFTVDNGVATLVLNRPDSLNSFNAQMHEEVKAAIREVRENSEIRCLLITSNGRGFCAGQDLNDRAVNDASARVDLGESIERNYNPLIRAISTLNVPVICAVNGVAAGAGANIAMACDIVFAARSASFIQSFAKIGLIPDSGGTWNLTRALGLPRAKALALLGEKLPAEQAEAWGMIWRCVDDEALMEEANAVAEKLASQPTLALANIKRLLNASFSNTLDHQLELEKETMRNLGYSKDYAEGVAAFLEKRAPQFKGE
ncbi:2-(1,2-epoxy-1,2-dihydrophenyl)acetyl-CoA isomerase PaaG [Enterovibrio sp. ZSDZ35]|uniref:2-(1,2-epoxy-1,2-dihydrophenyl)acetyl-CoA isomerase PaaG n=1 Tax=Enterovibrio qingdaonensis TaxID=2899818 RepID=A0ABT5QHG3_9GAMM|nr:2-(1,2-epoxy-1,2-dihydrophenyl)acetyl-CoA isomerase PaaG [Enterovibrio sp. ZSDZ35]MDD1780415.1 2-(1,2-epoxy-1,2-dihydrophenyl)acetyl-CoA isomerase PaaG [Enterovibrio sp. ZSDZ35]